MKEKTIKIGDVTIKVEFKELAYHWDSNRNSYTVTLKNDEGKRTSYTFYDSIYNTERNIYINDQLINSIIEQIQTDYSINENNFSSYDDFASEFGYERYDTRSSEYREGKKTYRECLKLGNKLSRVISEEWLENLEVFKKLS